MQYKCAVGHLFVGVRDDPTRGEGEEEEPGKEHKGGHLHQESPTLELFDAPPPLLLALALKICHLAEIETRQCAKRLGPWVRLLLALLLLNLPILKTVHGAFLILNLLILQTVHGAFLIRGGELYWVKLLLHCR